MSKKIFFNFFFIHKTTKMRPISRRTRKRHDGIMAELHGHLKNTGKLVEKKAKSKKKKETRNLSKSFFFALL